MLLVLVQIGIVMSNSHIVWNLGQLGGLPLPLEARLVVTRDLPEVITSLPSSLEIAQTVRHSSNIALLHLNLNRLTLKG